MKTHQIHLVRHGLTNENLNGQYIGASDVPLSNEGINRLKNLKKDFTYPKANKIYCSPLMRCRKTAELLYPESEIINVEGLAECNFGEWEGKTASDLKDNEKFMQWLSNSNDVSPEGGESMKNFTTRVLTTFEKLTEDIIRNNYKDTVVVTHGGVIMTILAAYGLPRAKFYDWVVNNGCGYSLRIMPSLWMRQKVGEVYSKVPYDMTRENNEESIYILDLVREASDRAYGENEEK